MLPLTGIILLPGRAAAKADFRESCLMNFLRAPDITAPMKLRTRLNLVADRPDGDFVAVLLADEMRDARSSVREEIEAANRVAAQVLGSLADNYAATGGLGAVHGLLTRLGHVRANDITLRGAAGEVLYRSPPATYKAGREAPQWFQRLLAPPPARQVFILSGGAQLTIEAESSRAILDAWDDLTRLLAVAALLLVVIGGLAFWLVDRALAPFPVIVGGLERLERGELSYRLPGCAARRRTPSAPPSTAWRRRWRARCRPSATRARRARGSRSGASWRSSSSRGSRRSGA